MKKFNMFGIALILLGIAVGAYGAVSAIGPVLAAGIGILLLGGVVLLMVLSHKTSDFATHQYA